MPDADIRTSSKKARKPPSSKKARKPQSRSLPLCEATR